MKRRLLRITILVTVTIVTFIFTIKWLDSYSIHLDEDTLDILLEESNNIDYQNRFINYTVKLLTNSKYLNPVEYVINRYDKDNDVPVISEKVNNKTVIYIYNTHENEKYSSGKEINIKYSVKDASNYLKEKLRKYNIESIVENGSITDVLNTNNWNYASSYKVSRMYLEKAKKDYSDLKYYVDIHRDSVSKKISTISINGKNYARTMFLLGLENTNYKSNQVFMEKLEKWLNINYPGLSRGIYEKKGKGVNGVYNQDFSSNCILIEVGGEENTYEEVINTMDVIAQMFYEYMKEEL